MAKNIMFQGTASSVGKSILTAAICKVLKSDGYSTAPFKSQNMALNSFITKDGKEMGRAQVVQAEAAGIEPQVEMNPILLKPTSDMGSQVVLMGKVYKNMSSQSYFDFKPQLKEVILNAYEYLDNIFDAIVIEGAGSPAEINLMKNDIVNMGLAEMVDSPVILIGDIDRGGVFASLFGTVMLMEEKDRQRIKGFIINKFRGDVDILKPGIVMIEGKINIPCLGVVPFMKHNIDDEDSVSTRFMNKNSNNITIGVVKLPYISNYTDFTALEMEEDIELRYITNSMEFKGIDLLILPGSKNTISDMVFLKNIGFDKIIKQMNLNNIPIIGICGGFQMLGLKIEDNLNVESNIKSIEGLGLLNIETYMKKQKNTRQISGNIKSMIMGNKEFVNIKVKGYEIHMGQTYIKDGSNLLIELEDGTMDGAINEEGNVFGTYLHGIFDNDLFRTELITNLISNKGINSKASLRSYDTFKLQEYDKLEKLVRNNVDIDRIKEIMGL